jgi:hypothetical protein
MLRSEIPELNANRAKNDSVTKNVATAIPSQTLDLLQKNCLILVNILTI